MAILEAIQANLLSPAVLFFALGLIAACDIALAPAEARFGLTEARLGLVPAMISPFVVRAIGERQARRLNELDPDGTIHTVAGKLQTGTCVRSGDGGPAANAGPVRAPFASFGTKVRSAQSAGASGLNATVRPFHVAGS